MIFLRRQLPLLITLVMGLVFAGQYYVPHPRSELMLTEVTKWLQIIGGFALVLGVTSLFHLHAVKIHRREPGWGYSFVLYAGMVGTIAVGLWGNGKESVNGTMTAFGWIYSNMMVPLQGTMFAILAFFIASAAFRAFRIRTVEGADDYAMMREVLERHPHVVDCAREALSIEIDTRPIAFDAGVRSIVAQHDERQHRVRHARVAREHEERAAIHRRQIHRLHLGAHAEARLAAAVKRARPVPLEEVAVPVDAVPLRAEPRAAAPRIASREDRLARERSRRAAAVELVPVRRDDDREARMHAVQDDDRAHASLRPREASRSRRAGSSPPGTRGCAWARRDRR